MNFEIRQALLEDIAAINALFRERISVWQRMDDDGRVQDVAYESLNIYARWLHGDAAGSGAWMSLETGAIHLNHLLLAGGIPVVAVHDDQVVGYTEAYASLELAPFGGVMHIPHLAVRHDAQGLGVENALIDHVIAQGRTLKYPHVTIAKAGDDLLTRTVERDYQAQILTCVQRYLVPARTGQVFYKAVEHHDANPAQINGWAMSVGRSTSARHHWEMLMPRIWDTIPQMKARDTYRMRFAAAGQDAFVLCQQGLYNPRSAEIYAWTPKPITAQLVASIKDWAHREGYRTLSMLVNDQAVAALGADAESDGYKQETYTISAK